MIETRIIMGMPITIEIAESTSNENDLNEVFSFFVYVDEKFSTYKNTSEIMRINRKELAKHEYSKDMQTIFTLSQKTKEETHGYFDIKKPDGTYDPSGIVKGWAIHRAAKILGDRGYRNFYVDAGGDVQTSGKNSNGKEWSVGIRNPNNQNEIVKTIYPHGRGVATSGTYIRGQHIYDPHMPGRAITDVVSLTVIGPNIYEADRFATAAFAMGKKGISFIEALSGFEGYMIDASGIATMTSGFSAYTKE